MVKFDVVVGNPPYQDGNVQIYTDFYISSKDISDNVCLIFPTGWQQPKNANNLRKMNNEDVKQDRQIVSINNIQHAFAGVAGAEWTNILLWSRGYDNGLNGMQRLMIDSQSPSVVQLPITNEDIEKPEYITRLDELVRELSNNKTLDEDVSSSKPYGLRPDILTNHEKYGLPPLNDSRKHTSDIRVFTIKGMRYVDREYPFPKIGDALTSYKAFVPKAWGNMSERNGLGGAYADIYIAKPGDSCLESYLECGQYETESEAYMLGKYLMTTFARALMYVNKYSQNNAKSAYKAIPKQDFTEDWWDLSIEEINEKLFDKYGIPQDIRDQVNANIQIRDESNIITL